MNFLNDKKNQPIVAGVAILVLLVVGFFMYKNFTGGSSSEDTSTMTSETTPAPSAAPATTTDTASAPANSGATAPVSTPGAQSAATTANGAKATQVVKNEGQIEPWRDDPFLPIGYKKKPPEAKKIPPIYDFPIPDLPRPKPGGIGGTPVYVEPPQPSRRMAGVLLNGRVYAILESNANTEIVQPGDVLKDGLAVVERIEKDQVVLKTTSKRPRYIYVRMAASPRRDTLNSTNTATYNRPVNPTPYNTGM